MARACSNGIFGMTPGPKIGEILEAVREAQASGELANRQEALVYVDYLLTSSPSLRGEEEI